LLKDIIDLDGGSFLQTYNNSIFQFVASVYPEYEWLAWKFTQCPRNYWDNVNNRLKFMDILAKYMNIQQMDDWYKLSPKVYIYIYV
jgi:hypothetical protein